MGLIKVVCGIIYQDNEIFICRRRPEKSLGGFWEFPGGKVEKGEECEISLLRELNSVPLDFLKTMGMFHLTKKPISLLY